jgi:hypothetical protein
MKRIFLFLLIATTTIGYSQKSKAPFEGVIKYAHNVVAKDKDFDVNYDYQGIGKSSDYYFKKGNIKWLTYNCYFKMDLFLAKENRDYFLTSKSDSIFTMKNNGPDFRIIDTKIEKGVTKILGHSCDVLTVRLKPLNAETPVTSRKYYYSSDFYINPADFSKCTSSGYDVIYGAMKSVPLKIEYEFPNRTIIWEATEIKAQKLEDSFFTVDKNALIGYW